jgi:hypothetical protein
MQQIAAIPQCAASFQLAVAQFALGAIYARGQGVPEDFVRAHMWLSLSAAHAAQIAGAQKLARDASNKSTGGNIRKLPFVAVKPLFVCRAIAHNASLPQAGRFFTVWPVIVFISLALWFLWIASRRGTFIAVDPQRAVLRASEFFLKPREIPIARITHIGISGMFGLWTAMDVTHQKPDGSKKTVGCGAKETLEKVQFQKVLDAIVAINPNLQIPPELRKV